MIFEDSETSVMKKYILSICGLIALNIVSASADTIVFWDFNSQTNDLLPSTGTFLPAIGSGSITNIGGTTNSFGQTQANANSDPNTSDNSALRMGQFPTASSNNKTAGIQVRTSTVGYENITVKWDQENSATASFYWRVQYTTNGTIWIDHVVTTSHGGNPGTPWDVNKTVDFSAVAGVKNNPNFGFRLVSEFQSTATGSGAASYIANQTGSSYSANGTLWVDMVTVSGTLLDTNNTDPTISAIPAQTNRVNQTIGPLSFTVNDAETPLDSLILSASSSNTGLIQNWTFGGSGANRTITLTPEADQTGLATITVLVTDGGGKSASSSFNVTVLPTNTPPTISTIGSQFVVANTVTNVPFTVNDLETSPDNLIYTIESWYPEVIPTNIAQVVGSGSNKSLQLSPTSGHIGATKLRLIVSDGTLAVTNLFNFKVVRPQTVANWTFNSPVADTNTATGTFTPVIGSGSLTNIGGTTSTFGVLGANNVDNQTTDPAPISDNSSLRLATFPAQNTANKTAGVELRFSTVGYQNIAVTWDQQNSSSANRYWRVQYTIDGTTFIDHIVYTNLLDGITFPAGANFAGISGVDNNPNFGIRIVSEFESTATGGATTNGYKGVQTSGNYGTGGTFWSDMFLITAEPYTAPPTLQVSQSGGNVQISWPASFTGYALEATASFTPTNWQAVAESPVQNGGQNVVTTPISGTSRFFRLKK